VNSTRFGSPESALASVGLPRREGQVIARTLNGATAEDIEQELKIGREAVVTYRKSFYSGLGLHASGKCLLPDSSSLFDLAGFKQPDL